MPHRPFDSRQIWPVRKSCPVRRLHGSYPETGFEAISLQLNDHTGRGVGGRQYGASEEIKTLQV